MSHTLEQQAHTHNNDYSHLEAVYHQATGGELVRDPYASVRHTGPDLTLSASVVIPAWNARGTLEQCLIAIEQSSFNRKYPELLEAVVVDDGSSDGTWELLQHLRLNVHLKAIQQMHHSRAHTQNTGIALARGDVIICCDADVILTPFTIEELVKRHQMCDHVMLIGFRGDVQASDPRIQPAALAENLPRFLPPFTQDMRVYCGVGGWPESMCRDSDHLKRLGGGKQIILADGGRWDLAGIGWGTLFSLRRSDFVAMDGYDERFYGWGCEDSLVGVRAQALKYYIIPVYSAAGLHIAHDNRSPRKWQEFSANQRVFQSILRSPFTGNDRRWLDHAKHRVQQHFERKPHTRLEMYSHLYDVFTDELRDADRRGKYLHSLGRYDEAASAFAEVRGTAEQEAWAMFNRGKALRVGGHSDQATALLEEAATCLPTSPWPLIEQALALAAQGRFGEAYYRLELACKVDPANSWLVFLLQRPAQRHIERANFYMRQGDYMLALWDYEAALILDPTNVTAQVERIVSLGATGQKNAARTAFAAYKESSVDRDAHSSAASIERARLYLALGELGPAKVVLEQMWRQYPDVKEVTEYMKEVQVAAVQAHPLPLARHIVEFSQAIPGWFGEDETELLIALVLKTVARRDIDGPPVLVEVGSYCGRATVAMGLTALGMGRDDARVMTVDEPTFGLTADGRHPRDVLRVQLAVHRLANMVIYVPEDDAAPWERTHHLLLIDGKHDYVSVRDDAERYSARLIPGGFLLFHDYADYFPDVQRYVNELLLDSHFEFVAQAGSLIALRKCSEISQQDQLADAAEHDVRVDQEGCSPGGTMLTSEIKANRGLVLTLPILSSMRPIEGWLEEDEADLLIAAASKALTELPPLHAVVEIGSYCGRSTVVLASVVKAIGAQTKVYAIDPHTGKVGSQDRELYDTMPTREKFLQNIADAGLADVVELVLKNSFEVLWDQPISLLLIDAFHDYANVSRDFFHFAPWIAVGAYIAFHDYADYYPGVKRFVDEILRSGHYKKIHCVRSMMVVQKYS